MEPIAAFLVFGLIGLLLGYVLSPKGRGRVKQVIVDLPRIGPHL